MSLSTNRQKLDSIIEAFFAACQRVGCSERLTSIRSSSGFDPSVRFIGSHISVFLPLMYKNQIPSHGIAMWQDCIRTRSLQSMLKTDRLDSLWGSYFIALGALFPDTQDKQACLLLQSCLEDYLHIPSSHIEVSYLENDTRLAKLATKYLGGWRHRKDTESQPYRHKVGISSIKGENLNIAISQNGIYFEPIANIIIYKNGDQPCGIEVALGTSTIVKVLYHLDHVVDTFPFPQLEKVAPDSSIHCWKDSAATSLQLLREGLAIKGQHNRHRIFRKYLTLFHNSQVTKALKKSKIQEYLEVYLQNYYDSKFILESLPETTNSLLIERLMSCYPSIQ